MRLGGAAGDGATEMAENDTFDLLDRDNVRWRKLLALGQPRGWSWARWLPVTSAA